MNGYAAKPVEDSVDDARARKKSVLKRKGTLRYRFLV
jgi:hypothetical protein